MVYNFSAEKRIYDLIEKASQGSLSEGSVVLNQALRALNQEFKTSHYGDLPKHDVERFKVRKRIYEAITGAYERLITGSIGSDETIEKENEGLKDRIEELTEEIAELNKAQQTFKNV